MNIDFSSQQISLGEHSFGRFDRRMPIGPVQWPFHDLLWIHEGSAAIAFPHLGTEIEITAPGGVLILPGTSFSGSAIGAYATASVCHFTLNHEANDPFMQPGIMQPRHNEALHLQNQVRLALHLASEDQIDVMPRRQRLLRSILDGFHLPEQANGPALSNDQNRLAAAWSYAARSIGRIRTLSDVAQSLGIRESALRTLHRKTWKTSAGDYLRELRLKKAEELLATTGYSLSEIAREVGYGHPETLSAAFKRSRGKTPGQYRQWSNPFA